jgi:hypothetical protein
VGSIPTWPMRASSSMDRAPNVPWPDVPVQQFSSAVKENGNEAGQESRNVNSSVFERLGAGLRSVNTFRLPRALLERKKQWALIWKSSFSEWERA